MACKTDSQELANRLPARAVPRRGPAPCRAADRRAGGASARPRGRRGRVLPAAAKTAFHGSAGNALYGRKIPSKCCGSLWAEEIES